MGRSAGWLSTEEIAVLTWVRDGFPAPGTTAEEIGRRITASALARRCFVSVKGSGKSWAASLTPAGHAWLAPHTRSTPVRPEEVDDLADKVSDLIARVVTSRRPVRSPMTTRVV